MSNRERLNDVVFAFATKNVFESMRKNRSESYLFFAPVRQILKFTEMESRDQ